MKTIQFNIFLPFQFYNPLKLYLYTLRMMDSIMYTDRFRVLVKETTSSDVKYFPVDFRETDFLLFRGRG